MIPERSSDGILSAGQKEVGDGGISLRRLGKRDTLTIDILDQDLRDGSDFTLRVEFQKEGGFWLPRLRVTSWSAGVAIGEDYDDFIPGFTENMGTNFAIFLGGPEGPGDALAEHAVVKPTLARVYFDKNRIYPRKSNKFDVYYEDPAAASFADNISPNRETGVIQQIWVNREPFLAA